MMKVLIVLWQAFYALLLAAGPIILLVILFTSATYNFPEISRIINWSIILIISISVLVITIRGTVKTFKFIEAQEKALGIDFNKEISSSSLWYIRRLNSIIGAEILFLHAGYVESVSQVYHVKTVAQNVTNYHARTVEIYGITLRNIDGSKRVLEGKNDRIEHIAIWLKSSGIPTKKAESRLSKLKDLRLSKLD